MIFPREAYASGVRGVGRLLDRDQLQAKIDEYEAASIRCTLRHAEIRDGVLTPPEDSPHAGGYDPVWYIAEKKRLNEAITRMKQVLSDAPEPGSTFPKSVEGVEYGVFESEVEGLDWLARGHAHDETPTTFDNPDWPDEHPRSPTPPDLPSEES